MGPAMTVELRSGETWRNPLDMYAALRDHDPVHHVADGEIEAIGMGDATPMVFLAGAGTFTEDR